MEINISYINLTRQIILNTCQRGQQNKHADDNNAALRDQICPLLHHPLANGSGVWICVCVCVHAYTCWCVVYPGCKYNQSAFFGHVCASIYISKTLIQALSTKDNNRRLKLLIVSFISPVKPQGLSHFSAQLCLLLQNIDSFLLGKQYMVEV